MTLDIKKSLENHLKSYPGLRAIHQGQICSGLAAKDWTAPYQTIFKISDPLEGRRIGIPCPRFQINNFSPSDAQATLMAELTIQALVNFKGKMGGNDGKIIIGVSFQDSSDQPEPEVGLYNCPVDVKIRYRN